MDNKVTKQRISDHMEYDWFKYLILAVAAVAIVVFTFNRINSNRDDEEITLFFSCYETTMYDSTNIDYEKYDFVHNVFSRMNAENYNKQKYGDPILRSVSVDAQTVNMNEYGTLYETRAEVTSDAIVVQKSYLTSVDGEGNKNVGMFRRYLHLDDEALKLMGIGSIADGDTFDKSDFEYLRIDKDGYESHDGDIYAIRVDTLQNIEKAGRLKANENELVLESEDEQSGEKTYKDTSFYLVINPSSRNIGKYGDKKTDPNNNQTFFAMSVFFEIYNPLTDIDNP